MRPPCEAGPWLACAWHVALAAAYLGLIAVLSLVVLARVAAGTLIALYVAATGWHLVSAWVHFREARRDGP